MAFNCHLSKSRTSSEAYFNSRFCLSPSRTSLEAYIDFKFYLSQSATTLEAYVDHDFHIPMLRTSLEVYIDLQATTSSNSSDSEVVGYDIMVHGLVRQ